MPVPAKEKMTPTLIKVGEPETTYMELTTARVWLGPEGKLAIEADPDEAWPKYPDEGEHPHNCDQMGCGQSHVIAWAELPRLPVVPVEGKQE